MIAELARVSVMAARATASRVVRGSAGLSDHLFDEVVSCGDRLSYVAS